MKSDRLKVLFVVNWYTPKSQGTYNAGVFHYEQAKALLKYCDVRLYWPLDTEVKGLVADMENGLFTYRSEWNKQKNKLSWFTNARKYFDNIIKDYQPDIIHANVAYPAGLLCVIEGKKYRIPVIHTEHAPIEQMYLSNPFRKFIRGYVYKNSIKKICVSKDSMNRLSEYYPREQFEVVYNAVIDPETIKTDGVRYRKDDNVNCCIVAAFYDEFIKGYQYLIPAVAELVQQGEKIHLHICGGGLYEEKYKKMASDLGILNNCTFYGQCDRQKVYSIVRDVDFCISSSIFECSGVSVQEEQLLGKPILVTKSGGANSLCTEQTSIVVDRESKNALVNGIMEMSKKYKDFDANKIRNYAFENFEIEHITKKYFGMYQEIVKND